MSGIRGTIEFVGAHLLRPDAENTPDDNEKIRARRNSDGTVTLFATPRSTGLWGRLTGLSSERERARDTMYSWLKQELGPVLTPEAKQVFREHLYSPELTFGRFRQFAEDIQRFKAQRPREETGETTSKIDLDAQLGEETLTLGSVDYTLGETLGTGASGEVRLAESETHGKVAVKVGIPLEDGGRLDVSFTQEFDMHRWAVGDGVDSHSSHIVGLKGAVFDDEKVRAVVTEYMPGGDVAGLMKEIERMSTATPPSLTGDEVQALRRLILRDMATGLAQIHGMPSLLHRDVKPPNFLISETGVVKIADFGTVQHGPTLYGSAIIEGVASQGYMGPETYVPDERLAALETRLRELKEGLHDTEANGQYIRRAQIAETERLLSDVAVTQASDVFMLGMSALEIYSGADITRGDAQRLRSSVEATDEQRDLIFQGYGIDGSAPEHALIRRMLSFDPEQRPTATEIAGHGSLGNDTPETRALLARIANGT